MSSTEILNDTILVVDDTLENLDVLITSMESFGFNFSVARSGQEMFKRLEQVLPALILLDVRMPGMTGFEACRLLKADERYRRIPVIFMTALSETVDKVKGFNLGAVDYITKPFQQEEVLARLRTHLTIQKLQNDLRLKNEELQAAFEREKKMLEDLRLNISYSLPHELRTPLHAIVGFTSTILDAPKLPEAGTLRKYLSNIRTNSRRLQRLIENAILYAELKMLRYAAPSENQIRRNDCYPFESSDFLESLARQLAKEKRRMDDLELDLAKLWVRVTPKHFNKIIAELLENSFKFSSPGTPVRLTTRQEQDHCLISISDRGRGMSAEQLAMMEAYTQFERRHYEQQGIGLGLIIAQLLTDLEGGELTIESNPQKGTVFHLRFKVDTSLPSSYCDDLNGRIRFGNCCRETRLADMQLPVHETLKDLLHVVEIGDMQELNARLQTIEDEDADYQPFIQKIRPLSEELELERLRNFLYDCLG